MYRSWRGRVDEAGLDLAFMTVVSSARGRDLAAWLAVGTFVPIFVLVGALWRGPLSTSGPFFLAIPLSLACAGLGAVVRRRRMRLLTIERRGREVRLVVQRGVDLAFPVRLRGEQHTYTEGRLESHALYLQVIGSDGRSVVFVEHRSRAQGREPGWLSDGLDRSMPHEDFDVGATGGGSITEIRAALEKSNTRAA